jgi:hypothetical protein
MVGTAEALARAIVKDDWKWPPRGPYLDLIGEGLPEGVTEMGEVVAALRARASRTLASYGYRAGEGGGLEPATDADKAATAEKAADGSPAALSVVGEARARGPAPDAADPNPAFNWLGAKWQTAPPVKAPERAKLVGYTPPQARMKARAAELGHRCELQAQVPTWNGGSYRAYGSFPAWEDALAAIAQVPPADRHFFELIPEGRPAKPYLDIDCKALPAGFADAAALVARVQELAAEVFRADLGVELEAADFVWLESPKTEAKGKACSLHLIIATHGPQLVYRDNEAAKHLAARLAPHFVEPVGEDGKPRGCVDVDVYTKNRLMRLAGSSKCGSASALRFFGSDGDTAVRRDSVISWVDDEAALRFIEPQPADKTVATGAATKGRGRPRCSPATDGVAVEENTAAHDIDLTEGGVHDPWLVADLLAALSSSRREERKGWLEVACALRHAGAGTDAYKDVWLRWSAASAKFAAEAEGRQWDSLSAGADRVKPITFGSLIFWAREDAPAAARGALARAKSRASAFSPDQRRAAAALLSASFPERLGGLRPDTTFIDVADGRREYRDPVSGLSGSVDQWNQVKLGEAMLGYLGGPLELNEPLSFIDRNIPAEATFLYERESPDLASFRCPSNDGHRISMKWHGVPGEATSALKVSVPGRNDTCVTTRKTLKTMADAVARGLDKQAADNVALAVLRGGGTVMGVGVGINNGIISVTVNTPEQGDDVGACKSFLEWLPSAGYRLVACNKCLYLYDPRLGIYRDVTDKTGMRRLIARSGIPDYCRNTNKQDALLKQIADFATEDDLFHRQAASSSHRKLAFANGVYDFVTRTLSPFSPDVVFFAKLPHAFPETPEEGAAADALAARIQAEVVLPIWDDVADFVMASMARCAAGEKGDKRAFFCLGDGNAGKGLFQDLVKSALHHFVGNFNSGNLLCARAQGDQAKANSWQVAVKDCRVIFSNEIKVGGGATIDGNVIKELASGGDEVTGRQNRQDEITFKLQSLPWIMANDIPCIKPLDDAVSNRVAFIPMKYVFHSEAAKYEAALRTNPNVRRGNDSLKEWVATPEVGAAFAYMLCKAYVAAKPELPEQVTTETAEWVEGESTVDKLDQLFMRGDPGDFLTVPVAHARATEADMGVSKNKLGLMIGKKYGIKSNMHRPGGGNSVRGFSGLKLAVATPQVSIPDVE